jgi:hypothetical protein
MIAIFIQELSVKKPSEEKVRKSRLLAIDQAIRDGGYPSLARLAEITKVNPRTIQTELNGKAGDFVAVDSGKKIRCYRDLLKILHRCRDVPIVVFDNCATILRNDDRVPVSNTSAKGTVGFLIQTGAALPIFPFPRIIYFYATPTRWINSAMSAGQCFA